jgi:hypothetical protein
VDLNRYASADLYKTEQACGLLALVAPTEFPRIADHIVKYVENGLRDSLELNDGGLHSLAHRIAERDRLLALLPVIHQKVGRLLQEARSVSQTSEGGAWLSRGGEWWFLGIGLRLHLDD